jgi:hypothetical protein
MRRLLNRDQNTAKSQPSYITQRIIIWNHSEKEGVELEIRPRKT